MASDSGSRSAARNGRDNTDHDWDHLADFWKLGIWSCSVRSDGAICVASAATLPSYVSVIAVALATGRHHPSGEYSELAGGSASQDPANTSTKPVTVGGNKQRAPRVFSATGSRPSRLVSGAHSQRKAPLDKRKAPLAELSDPAVAPIS